MSDELKEEEESYPDSDKLYFTKQHLKEALKDFRDKFHHETDQSDVQEISRSEAGNNFPMQKMICDLASGTFC